MHLNGHESSHATTTTTTTMASCPCQHVPLRLSSFTAAEHGNVSSLRARARNLSGQRDAAGNSPLHAAAQHGHVAATLWLLRYGVVDVNVADGGATPLHRASFSGALGTMRVLLHEETCDLLCLDTSFGDNRTALHKAAAGGRYHAVQLLLDALEERSLLPSALDLIDNHGWTALQVASDCGKRQEKERKSVARWDVVAGGVADWSRCVKLLEAARGGGNRANNKVYPSITKQSSIFNKTRWECEDCEFGQKCTTTAWENAFRTTLLLSTSPDTPKRVALSNDTSMISSIDYLPEVTPSGSQSLARIERKPSTVAQQSLDQPVRKLQYASLSAEPSLSGLGHPCYLCAVNTFVLYPAPDNRLICKRCKRKRN
jgi:hypothetical protein